MENTALVNKNILIAEDDDACRYLFELFLEGTGCSFTIVGNGEEALSKVRSEKFDVVLMDLRMPLMNGYEASRAIRETDIALSIIALTAHALAWEDGKCQASGMNDYLIKPCTKEQVIEKLVQWTDKKISDGRPS